MDVLNLGSLNIDRVFRVRTIVRPGETIASHALDMFAGGKGANQSVALARAGARVAHAGKLGADGAWLLEKLAREGVDTSRVLVGQGPTGQAIIQVDDAGQNAIVLKSGENHAITPDEIDVWLDGWKPGTWLLVQNEISSVGHAIGRAKQRGLCVAFNPAPMDDRVGQYPLDLVDLLCVNLTEGAALSGQTTPQSIAGALAARWPHGEIMLTLGADGVIWRRGEDEIRLDARRTQAVDTTAAGDTFLGYYLAGRARERDVRESLDLAGRAAALCVTRAGALDSIPRMSEVLGTR